MRAGPDAEVIAVGPVIEIVLTALPSLGIGRYFVLGVAGISHAGDAGFLHVPGVIHFRNAGRRLGGEQGVRLQGELVMREMLRIQGNRLLNIRQRHCQGLFGQGVHQIQIDVGKAGILRRLDRASCAFGIVDATQSFQTTVIEALHAETEPVHAGRQIVFETVVLHGSGIALHSDFAIRCETQARTGHAEDVADGRAGKQAGRTAAEEHAADGAPPHQRQVLLQVAGERRDVFRNRQFAFLPVRIEIAVRAFLHAPRNVDVQRQRRRHQLRHVLAVSTGVAAGRGRGG